MRVKGLIPCIKLSIFGPDAGIPLITGQNLNWWFLGDWIWIKGTQFTDHAYLNDTKTGILASNQTLDYRMDLSVKCS
jgi:hypothetical protein